METNDKIVRFDRYCGKCKHKKVIEVDDPCDACLSEPINQDTHKPVYFEEDSHER